MKQFRRIISFHSKHDKRQKSLSDEGDFNLDLIGRQNDSGDGARNEKIVPGP